MTGPRFRAPVVCALGPPDALVGVDCAAAPLTDREQMDRDRSMSAAEYVQTQKAVDAYTTPKETPPVSEESAPYTTSREAAPRLFSFSSALSALKAGERVTRKGWNGKGMFIFLVRASTFQVNRPPLLGIYPEGTLINYQSHIDMRTADGSIVPWLASQRDLLASDWHLI